MMRVLGSSGLFAGFLGFVLGGGWAAWQLLRGEWVREFQAGDGSPLAERLAVLAQRATVEGLGFALLGVVAAGVALVTRRPSAPPDGERAAARAITALGAIVVWTCAGSWLGNAALPLLRPPGLALLNVAGVAAAYAGLVLVHALARRIPAAARAPRPATALASAALWLAAAVVVQEQLFSSGPRTVGRWSLSLGAGVAAFLLTVPLARLVAPAVRALGPRVAEGRFLPRPLALVALGLFAVALATTLNGLELSSLPKDVEYADLEPEAAEPATGPNVVLVTIDTLRADHLGCYGYPRPTSPFLDSLAAGGTRCADASAPAAWTKPSTGTILTGLHPSRHGALHHGSFLHVPEGERTLAEAFRDAGYVTAGFVTNPNVKKVFDFDRGFQEYFDSFVEDTVTLAALRGSAFGRLLTALTRRQFNWKYENDVRRMNRYILPWLERNQGQPFFLYLHYIDPHTPYHPPREYREQFLRDAGFALHNERKRRVGIDLYDAEIRYTDDGLRALVGELERLGLWEDTMFVVTSDHGEEFFEHGYDGHGFSLFQPVVGVPLLLHGPGVPAGRVVEEPVQLLDLPATLVDLAGLGADRLGDGRSFGGLLGVGGPPVAESHFLENEFGMGQDEHRSFVFQGVRRGRFKLVRTRENKYFPGQVTANGGLALYDLELDPEERVNLIREPEYETIVEELLRRLREHSEFLTTEGMRGGEVAPLTPELEEDLKALGYL